MSARVTLVDYGMGNLPNVARAFERAGATARVAADPAAVRGAERLVVPGVGACDDAMAALRAGGLDEALLDWLEHGRPFLGICLGLQVLFDHTEEGDVACLGVIPGRVAAFPDTLDLPVPHMGWNAVKPERPHPVIDEGYFYFVHSYRATQLAAEHRLARTDYGEDFASAVGKEHCIAVQFHPEKSQRAGAELIARFCDWCP